MILGRRIGEHMCTAGFMKDTLLAGKVTSHLGHIQIQIGSSWGRITVVNGQQVAVSALRYLVRT